jgi:hypothetical protein
MFALRKDERKLQYSRSNILGFINTGYFTSNNKAIYIYQAMTLTKDSVLWNGLPQSDNIASPTFSEKNRNPLNLSLYLHLSNMSDIILRQFKNA